MPILHLMVDSGGNADDDINIQNGNMYFLKQIYNLPFQNWIHQAINVNNITMIPNVLHGTYQTYFNNLNNNTTDQIRVNIPLQYLNNTIAQLVNFSQNVGEGDIIDPNELNVHSLKKAIEVIWFTFSSNRIYENIYNTIVNTNHPNSRSYVNIAYDDYMDFYNDQDENEDLCYIHPLLFPKIFQLVFPENNIPMSTYEKTIPVNNYNETITTHNLQYIQNPNTILCIYRNPVVPQIMNLKAIQERRKNNMKVGGQPGMPNPGNMHNMSISTTSMA